MLYTRIHRITPLRMIIRRIFPRGYFDILYTILIFIINNRITILMIFQKKKN